MRIIYQNEPLLFVHGPPIFIRVSTTDEESTSVFVLTEDEQEELVLAEEAPEIEKNNAAVFNKIINLGRPFQRQIYKPLQFVLENEIVKGIITDINEETVWIEITDEEDLTIAVDINTIRDVLWRGNSFQE